MDRLQHLQNRAGRVVPGGTAPYFGWGGQTGAM